MKEIKTKSKNELKRLLLEKREALRRFRFQLSSGKSKNIKEGRNLRREIAKILTEINKK